MLVVNELYAQKDPARITVDAHKDSILVTRKETAFVSERIVLLSCSCM